MHESVQNLPEVYPVFKQIYEIWDNKGNKFEVSKLKITEGGLVSEIYESKCFVTAM